MNKTELVAAIAASTEVSKVDSEKVVNAFIEEVTKALQNNDTVSLKGFGSFEVRTRDARQGRNPRTGEVVEIAARNVPAFKVSSALKDAVNK